MKRFQQHDPDEEVEGLVADDDLKTTKGRLSSSKRQFDWFHPTIIIVIAIIILSGLLLLVSHFRSRADDFAKPLTDQRQYETFSLSNGLKVLAISDPTATTSAVALSLKVGSFADPVVMPGMAHFMEHLVFLGSYTYPDLDGYTKFVKNRGGANNAFTANEETNFFFKVPTSSFHSALDMFLHMFVDPIFTREWAASEVESVDAEYKMDLQNDAWKFEFALKLASNPRNPLSRFSIGNTESLITYPEENNVNIVQQLENFFSSFYSSNLMHLVILHNQSTNDMRSDVENKFSLISQKRNQKPVYDSLPKPFANEYSNKLVQFLTSGSDTTAHIIFCVDSSLPYTEVDPLNYLYAILNYESPGSLISVLKDNGWVLELQCQSVARQSSFELVDIAMTLTREGRKEIAEITRIVLAYLDLIRRKGLTQELFDQFSYITKYKFEYSQYKDEQEDILDEIRNIASNTGVYPTKYVLAGDKVLFNFDSDYMEQFLRELNTDNLMIFVSAPDFEKVNPTSTSTSVIEDVLLEELATTISANTKLLGRETAQPEEDTEPTLTLNRLDKYEELYKLDYSITSLSYEFLDSIRDISYQIYPELDLPSSNEYVPEVFELMGSDCSGSKCAEVFSSDRWNEVKNLAETPNKIWYLLERSFGVPLTTCYIRYDTANLETSSKHLATSGIFGELNNLVLNKDLYEIEYAGNDVKYKPKYMKIEAFTDTFPEVLGTVLDQYRQNDYTESQFLDAKANFISTLNQEITERPYSIALAMKDNFLLNKNVTVVSVLAQAQSLSFADFQDSSKNMKSNSRVEVFLYGNLLEEIAEEYAEDITSALYRSASPENQPYQGTVVNLQGKNLVYRARTSVLKDELTLTLNYYQGKPMTIKDITALKLIAKILDPEAFSYLRTEKKLGYLVALRDDLVGNVTGMKVLVLSSSFDTNEVDLEIENFWPKAKEVLDKLTDRDITQITKSYGEGLNYNSKSFRIKGEHVYNHVLNYDYQFDLEDRIREYLPKVTKDDLIKCFDDLVKQPRKLSIQLYSEEAEDIPQSVVPANQQYSNTTPEMIQSIDDLKSTPRYARDVSI